MLILTINLCTLIGTCYNWLRRCNEEENDGNDFIDFER